MSAVSTKAEKRWVARVVGLGCVVCRNLGYGESPAEFHHLRFGMGAGQRMGNGIGIPLCPTHHRIGCRGVAYHAGPQTWEALYGSQISLFNQIILELA